MMFGDKQAILLLATTVALSGCTVGSWFGVPTMGADNFVEPGDGSPPQATGDALNEYVDLMSQMLDGDPVRQAEIFRETAAAAESWPTTTHLLKLALAIATPGHPWSDADDAQHRLQALMNSDHQLTLEERALVRIQLRQVEQRLALDEEAHRLRSEAQEALARQSSDNARQLEAALQENRRLREELAEAQEKLEAITNIERSIRERESATDSP